MPRLFRFSSVWRAAAAAAFAGVLVLETIPHSSLAAGTSKQLQHVRGTTGYQTDPAGADFKPVFGKFDLEDQYLAVTRAQSAAVLVLPDSSLVALGENT